MLKHRLTETRMQFDSIIFHVAKMRDFSAIFLPTYCRKRGLHLFHNTYYADHLPKTIVEVLREHSYEEYL